jgi:hypothetical protein
MSPPAITRDRGRAPFGDEIATVPRHQCFGRSALDYADLLHDTRLELAFARSGALPPANAVDSFTGRSRGGFT